MLGGVFCKVCKTIGESVFGVGRSRSRAREPAGEETVAVLWREERGSPAAAVATVATTMTAAATATREFER